MKVLFPQCMDCSFGVECYEEGFERCHKIEAAGVGMGIQVKQKDNSYLRTIPFGVFMALKHIVARVDRDPCVDENYDANLTNELKSHQEKIEDFVQKISVESGVPRLDLISVMCDIQQYGNINDAIKCYNKYGYPGLSNYVFGIKRGDDMTGVL